jgi:hypothetical protein
MYKNPFWILFLAFLSLVTAWYVGRAFYLVYEYSVLQRNVPAKTIEWRVDELSDEQFVPEAAYTYEVDGKTYEGKGLWTEQIYRNAYAAQLAIMAFKQSPKRSWTIWFDPTEITHSSLQKTFPIKECIYAGLLSGILLYFIGLGYYVSRQKERGPHG